MCLPEEVEPDSVYYYNVLTLDSTYFSRILGKKRYELTNHLGNVMVTISDKKTAVSSGNPFIADYYLPDIKSAQDFYPFGATMPGRNFNTTVYRFAFNGKERDDEVKGTGNSYDYGFRMYDPRIGKFLSVDPIFYDYPWVSTYAFAENQLIWAIDLEGLERFKVIDIKQENGTIIRKYTFNPRTQSLGPNREDYLYFKDSEKEYRYTPKKEDQAVFDLKKDRTESRKDWVAYRDIKRIQTKKSSYGTWVFNDKKNTMLYAGKTLAEKGYKFKIYGNSKNCEERKQQVDVLYNEFKKAGYKDEQLERVYKKPSNFDQTGSKKWEITTDKKTGEELSTKEIQATNYVEVIKKGD